MYYEGVTVTYTINSEKSAWIYANISDYKKNLISDSLVASAIKSSSKELNSTDATNRPRSLLTKSSRSKISGRLRRPRPEAKVKTTQAKAEADAAVIKAQGEADANKLLNDSITEKILKQQYYDKWDGKLPSVMNSDSSNLILDIGNVTDGTTTAEK